MLFELSSITERTLRQSLVSFHGLFEQNKCQAQHLEELVFRALDIDPDYHGTVVWNPGSHNAFADIRLQVGTETFGLSIKSGTFVPQASPELPGCYLAISGHRLSQVAHDFHLVNHKLATLVSDCMIAFVFHAQARTYQIVYVDRDVFTYPLLPTGWKLRMGKQRGNLQAYTWLSAAGMYAEIRPALSHQIWWHIPVTLCRMGTTIGVGGSAPLLKGVGHGD